MNAFEMLEISLDSEQILVSDHVGIYNPILSSDCSSVLASSSSNVARARSADQSGNSLYVSV